MIQSLEMFSAWKMRTWSSLFVLRLCWESRKLLRKSSQNNMKWRSLLRSVLSFHFFPLWLLAFASFSGKELRQEKIFSCKFESNDYYSSSEVFKQIKTFERSAQVYRVWVPLLSVQCSAVPRKLRPYFPFLRYFLPHVLHLFLFFLFWLSGRFLSCSPSDLRMFVVGFQFLRVRILLSIFFSLVWWIGSWCDWILSTTAWNIITLFGWCSILDIKEKRLEELILSQVYNEKETNSE